MKDIKSIKKNIVQAKNIVVSSQGKNEANKNVFSIADNILVKGLMITSVFSVFAYVFFVSSTVYFAVKEQKLNYALENIQFENVQNYSEIAFIHTDKKSISYINKNSITSVSLK